MRTFISILSMTLILCSCSNGDDSGDDPPVELIGKWKIIEQYSDPGDGSGVYAGVESDKTIEFVENFTTISDWDMCEIFITYGDQSTGTFEPVDEVLVVEGFIYLDDCEISDMQAYYKIEDNQLIITYTCIEGCGQKFVKVQ